MKSFGRLVVASNNQGKLREIHALLDPCFDEILSMKQVGIDIEVEEDGDTFAANATKKAEEICALAQCAVLSDDSGLCVDALDGAPGVYSARFSGVHGDDAANNVLLLKKLKDVPWEQRTARFVSVVALARPGKPTLTAAGEVEGHVMDAPQGDGGFGYDPLFYADELSAGFGVATPQQKNSISHRARALAALRAALHTLEV